MVWLCCLLLNQTPKSAVEEGYTANTEENVSNYSFEINTKNSFICFRLCATIYGGYAPWRLSHAAQHGQRVASALAVAPDS